MKIPQSVGGILRDHVTLELECLDRLYLNVYVPQLQYAGGVAAFLKGQRAATVASTALVKPMTEGFVAAIKAFATQHAIPIVQFRKGQRKDDVAQEYLARCTGTTGVLFIGVAQEKARLPRTESRRHAESGVRYPWVVETTGYVKYYYIYAVDAEVGPFFLKFCSYFPYNGRLCLNGHEYLKRKTSDFRARVKHVGLTVSVPVTGPPGRRSPSVVARSAPQSRVAPGADSLPGGMRKSDDHRVREDRARACAVRAGLLA
jgi:hypothetical protein